MARWPGATGERLTMQKLMAEGLEIRVGQLEKQLEAIVGAA
jgi:hypothetical protein